MRARLNVPDLVAAVALFVLGAIMVAIAPRYGLLGEGGRLAPGTMPAVWGAGLMGSAVGVAAGHGFRARTTGTRTTGARPDGARVAAAPAPGSTPEARTGVEPTTAGDGVDDGAGTESAPSVRSWRKPASIYLLLVVAVLASRWVGFLVAFGALMLVLLVFVERRAVVPSVATALGSVAVAYLLFDVLLQIPIP